MTLLDLAGESKVPLEVTGSQLLFYGLFLGTVILLIIIHPFSVDDQKSILEEEFRAWIGNNVQLDDIMVIGFRPLGKSS